VVPLERERGSKPCFVMRSSKEDGLSSRATKILNGLTSTMSRRRLRLLVTQTLEPPSIIFVAFWSITKVLTKEESPWTPQTRGEQTTCVTLSRMEGMVGSCARTNSISWSALRLMATELGETGHENTSKRESGGKGEASQGGGLGEGNIANGRSSIDGEAVRAIFWWQGCRDRSTGERRQELRVGGLCELDVVGGTRDVVGRMWIVGVWSGPTR
jgi:hypothetical protein